jgi:hypothetical protein
MALELREGSLNSTMETISNSGSGFPLLLAIGECHRRLKRHAIYLSEIDGVRAVKHVVEMPDLIGRYRLEEYVDAELVSGEAISWCLEITVTETAILVEADVRRIHAEGQDVVAKIGEYRYSREAECSAQLRDIAERLCTANPL